MLVSANEGSGIVHIHRESQGPETKAIIETQHAGRAFPSTEEGWVGKLHFSTRDHKESVFPSWSSR